MGGLESQARRKREAILRYREKRHRPEDRSQRKLGSERHQEEFDVEEWAVDNVRGGLLCPAALRAARAEEMQSVKNIGVVEDSTWEECVRRTGAGATTHKGGEADMGATHRCW